MTVALGFYHDNYDYGINQTVAPGTLSAGLGTFRGYYNSEGNDPFSPGGPGAAGHSLRVDDQSITIAHDFGWAKLKSITARRSSNDYESYDQDAGPGHFNDARYPYSLAQYSQELHLSSPDNDHLFGLNWHWLGGIFYLNSKEFLSLDVSGELLGGGLYNNGTGTNYTKSYSAFFDTTIEVLPETNLTLGVRETADRITNLSHSVFIDGGGDAFPTVNPPSHADATRTTWRAVLDHKILPDVMAYASVSEGFKSGGYNLFAAGAPATRPELITAYMLGLKSEWLDRRLQANVEVFDYSYSNQQVAVVENGVESSINAASSRIYGGDFKLTGAVTRDFMVYGGVGYLEGHYNSFPRGPVLRAKPSHVRPDPAQAARGTRARSYSVQL